VSIVDHFRNKIVSARRDVYIIQFYAGYQQKRNFRGIFCLCVENVMLVLDPFLFCFFRPSHGVGRLFIYTALVVISGQTGFALEIELKC